MPKDKPPSISEAEWDVIKVLWERQPLTAGQVVAALAGARRWRPRTVKTLLARLVKKGAVRARIDDTGKYFYQAAVSRQAVTRYEARSFLSRVFDGALLPAVVTFLKEGELSPQEIQQLREILKREDRP